ncbi:MAG: cyclic pyranopterin monophosphate synthase MoaC [Methanocellales archaeon]
MRIKFSHIKEDRVKMVDISRKSDVERKAIASGRIYLKPSTVKAIEEGKVEKGNVLAIARVAAIMAVKRTPELIPLCHPLQITSVDVSFKIAKRSIEVKVEVKSLGKTGVEMEALTGATTALLAIWDMVKSAEKDKTGNYPTTRISEVKVIEKIKGE